ncbi:MAG: HIT family protein [Phycisphaerae bacterium]
MDCIFCKIISGQIPALKIYENDQVLSFLDIGPLSDGHTLVIPRKHYSRLDQMPADEVAAVAKVLPELADAVICATGAEGYNILQNNGKVAGQLVEHVHFHIIPRVSDDGLGYRWNAKKYPTGKDQEIQRKIIAELK